MLSLRHQAETNIRLTLAWNRKTLDGSDTINGPSKKGKMWREDVQNLLLRASKRETADCSGAKPDPLAPTGAIGPKRDLPADIDFTAPPSRHFAARSLPYFLPFVTGRNRNAGT